MKSGWSGSTTKGPGETIKLGEVFSDHIQKGDVFALIGDMGSGKTTFVKGILKGLNSKHIVTSPTFTLINEYYASYPIIHIDCYREESLERWIKLGINDYLDDENILIIEWADKIKSILPANTIYINFHHKSEEKRIISLQS